MDPQIKDKLEEAEFFLGEMAKSFQDDIKFKFMYSAFLSAGQSALYYLVSRYKNKPGFNDWYWGKKGSGMRIGGRIEKPEIKHLMNARGSVIHVESIPQGATRELSYESDCIIVDPREPQEQGDKTKPSKYVYASQPKTIVRWLINEDSYMRYSRHGNLIDDVKHIPALKTLYSSQPTGPNNADILKLSRAELDEVKKLIGEAETQFP